MKMFHVHMVHSGRRWPDNVVEDQPIPDQNLSLGGSTFDINDEQFSLQFCRVIWEGESQEY